MIIFDDNAKKIGLVIADEKQATMEYFKDWHLVKLTWNKFEVYWANQGIINLYILFCGCGEVQAASGTQYLIDNFNVDQIINYGVVGGINPEFKTGDVVLVSDIIPYQYDLSPLGYEKATLPKNIEQYLYTNSERLCELMEKVDLPLASCASGDKFLLPSDKKQLWEKYEADICDMESYGIAYTCNLNKIPFIMIKAVSDDSNDGGEEYRETLYETSLKCLKYLERVIL